MKLLLLSNSTNYGQSYLSHALDIVKETLGTEVLFVPYAGLNHDAYTSTVREALKPCGIEVTGIHEVDSPTDAVETASAIFVGGGNTFLLLKLLQEQGLIEPIHRRVSSGDLTYMGASAGTNISAPSIRTTNDMPIVEPESFEALNLVPFQINPHYLDADPNSTHNGETRATRLNEFIACNKVPVLGLREGTWLQIVNGQAKIGGQSVSKFSTRPAVLFATDGSIHEISGDVSELLSIIPEFDQS